MSASSYEMVERAAVLTAGPSYDPDTGDISEEAWADWVQLVDDWASMAGDKLLALEAVLDRLSSEHGLHKQRASMHSARAKVLDTQGKRVKGLAVMLLERAAELTGEPKQRMTDGRFRHMPITENGELVGIVTIGDVVAARLEELSMERNALEGMIMGH